ncbi:hypothetical protein Hanom_Chr07g00592731 [Helianthus anomalus]
MIPFVELDVMLLYQVPFSVWLQQLLLLLLFVLPLRQPLLQLAAELFLYEKTSSQDQQPNYDNSSKDAPKTHQKELTFTILKIPSFLRFSISSLSSLNLSISCCST